MTKFRQCKAIAAMLLVAASASWTTAAAQGVTTGAVGGVVTDSLGNPLSDVQIRITNTTTGYVTGGQTRADGRYFVQGLEVGGPYEILARRIGFAPATKSGQYVALSQTLRADFTLTQQVTQVAGVTITAITGTETFTPTNTGVRTIISDTTLQRAPTLTRNLVDFIRLTPQVSASGPGFSGGGMSNRMNNVQIDGASERDVFGLGSTGQPGAEVNAKSVSLEAVKEFQVLLAPFDVRQGNFGGLLLNAVTKSGTNQLHGSAFYFYRNEKFGADTSVLRATPFDRTQYGFSLGGPIIKDKLHFFITPEFQKENSPVTGPYAGQPSAQIPRFAISDADRTRFESIMTRLGETSLGSAGAVNIPNPLSNLFGRLDYRINDAHRLVFRYNYSNAERLRQQNNRGSTAAVYSSNFHNFKNIKNAPVLQLYSNFANGSSNELFLSYNNWYNRRTPVSSFPQIRVNTVVGPNGNASILAGADQFSQGNELDTETWELTENFTFRPMGRHTITVGTRNEYVKLRNLFTQSSYGVWSFANLDSLDAGNANSFRKALILSEGGNVYFDALQNAFYAQDFFQVNPRLAITAGLRFDITTYMTDVAYNAAIDSAYGRRTDNVPGTTVQFSPRLGFNWDLTGDQKNQLRGGVGLFVGTPPYVWLENAYVNSGNFITFLNCNTSGSTLTAPAFNKDASQVNSCRSATPSKPIGDVNFLADGLKFPQPLRASLGFDRQLPGDLVATFEGLFSKNVNQLFFVSKNVTAPLAQTGQGGRVLYASAVNTGNGRITLTPPAAVVANGGTGRFSTAIDLQNQNKDYAYNLTAQLRKRYSNNWEAQVAYTYSRARDVQSFSSSTAISNWQFGRTLSGRQEDAFTGVSLFDQPHKVMAAGTYTLRWLKQRLTTDFTVNYQGASGSPHDYIYASSGSTSGDLNGDGSSSNDLIYVPTRSSDPAQIQFRDITGTVNGVPNQIISSAANQAAQLDAFIDGSECLKGKRGAILTRNVCRLPFTNEVNVSIRQSLPEIAGQRISAQVDIFNFGNLLNDKWGVTRVSPLSGNSNIPLLRHVGYSTTNAATAVPVVQFSPPAGGEYINGNFVGNFWRTQISFRLAF
ncbi:MAG: carboxypeptidase regulatory-like domain-containing protein [Gemmatimonadaceae bacterium]|nr:carboxypeptidase regulatory-like domain-containing protein [Gemmatimonadaceae bacterium]